MPDYFSSPQIFVLIQNNGWEKNEKEKQNEDKKIRLQS